MRKRVKSAISLFVALFLVFSIIPFSTIYAKADGVDDFIGRCYKVTLGRDADADGYAYWRDILVNRKQDGSVVAHGFLFSPEYIDKQTPPEQYVKDLYMLFMGREPEQAGYDYWCEKMANGETREQIFAGFANSKEYFDLCYGYGITAGYYTADYGIQQVNGVNLFVERMYQTSLGRLGDQGGQNDWVQALLEGRITGIECARCFVQSPEFINKGLSDEAYLKSLYKAFMGREYDDGGLAYWLANIKNGYTRDEVFAGFANSPEFEGICNFYGIIRGDYTPTDIGTYNPDNPNNVSPEDFDLNHTHKFDQKNTNEKYLKNSATCTEVAVYYYSCECGEKGAETFTIGDAIGHQFDQNIAEKYLKSVATCTEPAVYYLSCSKCGEKDFNQTFKYGDALGHDWDEGTVTKEATATEKGIKTYKCKRSDCNETKTELIPCDYSNVKVGDIITFGNYEQDGNLDNGKEDLEWQVLSVEDGNILVISKYALDAKQYFNANTYGTWETSFLREWLNNDFYNNAFSENEKKQIPSTILENKDNSYWAMSGGNNTTDKVFCLSVEEIEMYFGDYSLYYPQRHHGFNQKLICAPTQYAINNGASYVDITLEEYNDDLKSYGYTSDVVGTRGCWWWLRTPGHYSSGSCTVGSYGHAGEDCYSLIAGDICAVRPAIYINLSSNTNEEKTEYEVGQIIKFGQYEQDNNLDNGKEDIEWEVLSAENGRALVQSKYALDAKPYNDVLTSVTWETCTLRNWLNNEFYLCAFSDAEKEKVCTVTLRNQDNYEFGTYGGNYTNDKVFCLSIEELEKYYEYEWKHSVLALGYNKNLICKPTKYAESVGAQNREITSYEFSGYLKSKGYSEDIIGQIGTYWILRTPGRDNLHVNHVGFDGQFGADFSGEVFENVAVRPAMYIEY